jgi:hypothetical protein
MPHNGLAAQRRIRLKGFAEGTPVGARGQKPPTPYSEENESVGGVVGHARLDSSVCSGWLCGVSGRGS